MDLYWTRDKDPRVPLGHASLLTALRERGLDVRSLVVAVNEPHLDAEGIVAAILGLTKGLSTKDVDVAFGAYVWGESLLRDVLRRLRRAGFSGRIVLGGPQVSYSGAGLEQLYPEADAFIRGYGEEALALLASSPDPRPIAGVHWAGTPDALTQAAVDLQSLPSPWLSGAIPLANQLFVRWETQRGCPFRCSFCQHREPGVRLRRRTLGLSRIEAEIDLFCEAGVREIAVLDPIFNVAPHAVGVLRRFAERGFTGRLSLQCRAEAVDEAFLDAASALDVCLEFGLQTIHADEGRAIERGNQIDRVDATLARCEPAASTTRSRSSSACPFKRGRRSKRASRGASSARFP
ncbi:MAG: cobalamin B12-binding domain-containing protein [Sandaracinus sp.]|nr:cobalamin B12-binding domain-containing protein [Sandaracinus sp.]